MHDHAPAPAPEPTPVPAVPLTLHFVRHGKTVFNTTGRVQGSSDSPLTAEGREVVRRTARMLADIPFVAAYTSPLGRTLQTSELLLAQHPEDVPLTPVDDLRELGFGVYEGGPEPTIEEIRDAGGDFFTAIKTGDHSAVVTPPEGEELDDFLTRLRRGVATIVERHPEGGDVLVVSHGGAIAAWLMLAERDGAPGPTADPTTLLPNASVSIVRYDGGDVPEILVVGATEAEDVERARRA
ncbi:MAG: histidine phosphatase family protein [Propionibacteriaceae bacterium]|jgi:probable phosphoglycerate mutase|nr:histidine phosphatase family protein [Propionibacteriaceae bacterium]